MIQRHIITFFISYFLVLCVSVHAQNKTEAFKEAKADTLPIKNYKYGIRFGTDLIKLGRTFLDKNYSGFEIIADYRLTERWYVAGELGAEKRNFTTNYLNTTTKGNYVKAGFDYNMHDNLFALDNMVFSGFRIGYSNFSQIINQSTVYTVSQYWQPIVTNTNTREFKGLNAIWAEVLMGIKAEVLNNLYLGLNLQLKYLVTADKPDNFANFYIPGFNKIFEDSKIGSGISYTISYRIPVYTK